MPPPEKVLSRHKSGQYYKKVRGKFYYFGVDYDAAVDEWLRCKDHLLAGRGRPIESSDPTIRELANLYYDACEGRISSGDLDVRSLADSTKTLCRLIDFRGEDDQPSLWLPLDFKEIKQMLCEPIERAKAGGRRVQDGKRAPATVNGDVRRIKAFLNWCATQKLIKSPDFGDEFSESSARAMRIAKAKSGKKTFAAKDILAIIAECNQYLLPVVMLGINAGMGAKDIALLTLDQFDGSEWLDCPRNKTGAARRVWLWPETRKVIKKYLTSVRGEPSFEPYEQIAFLTKHRSPWVRDQIDSATQMFTKTRKNAGVKSGSFYDLRRTFQTIGEDTLDFPAVQFCMGHIPSSGDMAAKYREVSELRIKNVCERVRRWLYAKPRKRP